MRLTIDFLEDGAKTSSEGLKPSTFLTHSPHVFGVLVGKGFKDSLKKDAPKDVVNRLLATACNQFVNALCKEYFGEFKNFSISIGESHE